MTPSIFEALHDVQEMRKRLLDRQLFTGYSGKARIFGGVMALIGAMVLGSGLVPNDPQAHLLGWGCVCALSFAVNAIGLLFWYRSTPRSGGILRPVLDLVAPFVVGGVLTLEMVRRGAYDMLFGNWLCLFGLMNIAARHSLPRTMAWLGWYYICVGLIYIFVLPQPSFLDPWPMGIAFFLGEIVGGLIFLRLRHDNEFNKE